MVFSASGLMADFKGKGQMHYFLRQFVVVLIGAFCAWMFSRYDYNKLKEYAIPILVVTAGILVGVLIFAPSINGARRWLRFAGFSFQPAEMAKLSIIIFIAAYLQDNHKKIKDFKQGILFPFIIISLILILIVLEKDLGIPFIIMFTSLVLFYIGGMRFIHIFYMIAAILPCVVFAIIKYPYRVKRMMIFIDPWSDPAGAGYQIIQSLSAIGSGGIRGKGLGNSVMKNLFLPEAHTDFIFPIIGEEFGLAGTITILFLFICFFYAGVYVAKHANNIFGNFLALGITFLITFQAIFNIGVSISLFPTKGLPLPFISFGGSAILMTLIGIGVLLNICKQANK